MQYVDILTMLPPDIWATLPKVLHFMPYSGDLYNCSCCYMPRWKGHSPTTHNRAVARLHNKSLIHMKVCP